MVSARALQRAEEAIAATIAQADRCVSLEDADGVRARRDLLSVLEEADKRLARKIAAITPKRDGSMKFSAAQAIAYRTQIGLVIERTKLQLEPIATEAGKAAIDKSLKSGAAVLAKLEVEFKGVSTSPALLTAMQHSQVTRGPKASLVTRVATSLDRYGQEMGAQFSRILQVGLASGASNEEMVQQLIAHGGPRGRVSLKAKETAPGVVQRIQEGDIPEGLFVKHKYWAERLIRTEVAFAHGSTKLEQLRVMRADGSDVKKKIVAHFDNRTAPDSIGVHGQVRELEENFADGAGRLYLHPPGRPNDRETLLPWFDDWKETPSTEPPTDEVIEGAQKLEQEEPPLPPKPPVTVEELEQIKGKVEQATLLPPAPDPETAAAARLLQIERERIASLQALALKLEEEKKANAEFKARRATDALDFKFKRALVGKGRSKAPPHEAMLDLVRVAASTPEQFARLYQVRVGKALPVEVFVGAVSKPEVFNALLKDVFGGYADPDMLENFKRTPAFGELLTRLQTAGDSRSKQLLASLVHTEQPLFTKPNQVGIPWKTSLEIAKKSPGFAVDEIRKKYGFDALASDALIDKYRATYGALADRIAAAERRMHAALDMTLEDAIKLAEQKLPEHTRTTQYLKRLQGDVPITMVLRDKKTLREMADAVTYGHEIRAHAALLGHVKDLKALKPKGLELDVSDDLTILLQKTPKKVSLYMDRAKRGAAALSMLLDESLALPRTLGQKASLNYAKNRDGTPSDRESANLFGLNLTMQTSVDVAAHEYSHLLCMRHAELGKAEFEFLHARAKGGPLRRLKDITGHQGYGDDEVAYDAGFVRPYTGREYGNKHWGHIKDNTGGGGSGYYTAFSNEVTAQGSSHLFEGGVEKLYEKDEAHLFFTLSQYRGAK